MAITASLVRGSTTLNIDDGSDYRVGSYDPNAGTFSDRSVTERISVLVFGTTSDDLLANRTALTNMLRLAVVEREYNPTYWTFKPDGATLTWRAKILSYTVVDEPNPYEMPWDNLTTELNISWEREHWEANAEVQVPLTNTNGTNDTSGLNVFNCNDGSGSSPNDRVNYVAISGSSVTGDLPAKTRIEMINPHASYIPTTIWIGHNYTNPTDFVWNFEGEDATVASGTTTVDANSSGGDYATCGTFLGNGTFNTLFTWALSSAQVDAAAGRPFHVMVRFKTAPNAAIRYRLITTIEAGASDPTDYTGPTVYLDSGYAQAWRDLGVIRIPARLMALTGNIGRNLIIEAAYDDLLNLYDLSIDTIMLMPADGWRVLSATLGRFPQNYRLTDDAINERIVLDDGSNTNRSGGWHGFGLPIALQPGKDQRLYFIQHNTLADSAPIDMQLTVKVYCRPRRITL